jgi:hypothetical protein
MEKSFELVCRLVKDFKAQEIPPHLGGGGEGVV